MASKRTWLARLALPLAAAAPAMAGPLPQDVRIVRAAPAATAVVDADEDSGDKKPDSNLIRTRDEVQILFEGRIDLMLDEVARTHPIEEGRRTDFGRKTEDAVTAFLANHEIEYGPKPRWSGDPRPMHYEPFTTFLESAAWQQLFRASLSEEAQALWLQKRAARQQRIADTLAKLFEAEVVHSFCLQQAEREDIGPATKRAAGDQIDAGLVGNGSVVIFNNEIPDPMFERMTGARLKEGLSGPRAVLLETIQLEGRTSYHDYCFEAEYLLYERENSDELRLALYGCAEALAYRDGGHPQALNFGFSMSGKASRDRYWERVLRGYLDLGDDLDLDELPSRTLEEIYDTRAEFYLAMLDERATFSAGLRDSLRPLLREYVVDEYGRMSTYRPVGPQIPDAFGLSDDGVVSKPGDAIQYLSTKQKSKISALRDSCSQQQRDVLDV